MAQIFKIREFDLLATGKSEGDYYFCTDTRFLYKDTSTGRHKVTCVVLGTELDRNYNVNPVDGSMYYVVETNELWLYNFRWIVIIGQQRTSSGYYYSGINNILNSTSDIQEVLDNNGLIGDGSVVVRDTNRVIKGKIYINQLNNNLVFSSFLGGGIHFLPDGSTNSHGELKIESIKTYQGLDGEGNVIYSTAEGKMTFSGDIYCKDVGTGVESKVVTMQDLIDLGIMTT